MHRVEALADRPAGHRPSRAAPYDSLIPLPEVLSEVYGVGAGSKQVEAEYAKLLARLGPELTILRAAPLAEIAAAGGERLAEGIGRMRRGEVVAEAGYDGEYGVIRLFRAAALPGAGGAQFSLFGEEEVDEGSLPEEPPERKPAAGGRPAAGGLESKDAPSTGDSLSSVLSRPPAQDALIMHESPPGEPPERRPAACGRPAAGGLESKDAPSTGGAETFEVSGQPQVGTTSKVLHESPSADDSLLAGLNPAQRDAVLCTAVPLVIVAGPGTGKTHPLRAHRAPYQGSRCRAGGHPGNHLHQQGCGRDGRAADHAARGEYRSLCDRQRSTRSARTCASGPRRPGWTLNSPSVQTLTAWRCSARRLLS